MSTLIRSARDAEEAARKRMADLGFLDARLTGAGPDGGVDVRAARAVAQVKAQVAPVGAPVIQAIYGIAQLEGSQALCFALGGYTPAASRFADRAGVALFGFDLAGDARACNETARRLEQGRVEILSAVAAAATVGPADPPMDPPVKAELLARIDVGDRVRQIELAEWGVLADCDEYLIGLNRRGHRLFLAAMEDRYDEPVGPNGSRSNYRSFRTTSYGALGAMPEAFYGETETVLVACSVDGRVNRRRLPSDGPLDLGGLRPGNLLAADRSRPYVTTGNPAAPLTPLPTVAAQESSYHLPGAATVIACGWALDGYVPVECWLDLRRDDTGCWERELLLGADAQSADTEVLNVHLHDKNVLVISGTFAQAIRATDGKPVWSTQFDFDEDSWIQASWLDGARLVCAASDGIYYLSASDGRTISALPTPPLGPPPRQMAGTFWRQAGGHPFRLSRNGISTFMTDSRWVNHKMRGPLSAADVDDDLNAAVAYDDDDAIFIYQLPPPTG